MHPRLWGKGKKHMPFLVSTVLSHDQFHYLYCGAGLAVNHPAVVTRNILSYLMATKRKFLPFAIFGPIIQLSMSVLVIYS